jgi:ABC-type hemin transport system ATPase subunit
VLHDLNLAMRFADRVVLLHRGKLAVDGGRTEAITAETIRAGPGCLNRISASISGASAGVRPPRGKAAS